MVNVMFFISDPMLEGMHMSQGVIGGIVGGLLFLFVAIVLAVCAVKIFNKRKQRERAMRYGECCVDVTFYVNLYGLFE